MSRFEPDDFRPHPSQRRPGTVYFGGTPFYCPWCEDHPLRSGDNWYDHAFNHRDQAPNAHLIVEEYWPVGLGTHVLAEGVTK